MSTRKLEFDTDFFNEASFEELVDISGIGPVLARRIINYRTENGPFASMDELEEIQGIGPNQIIEFKAELDSMFTTDNAEKYDDRALEPVTIGSSGDTDVSQTFVPEDVIAELDPDAASEETTPSEVAAAIETAPIPDEAVKLETEPQTTDTAAANEPSAENKETSQPETPTRRSWGHDILLVGLGGLFGLVLSLVAMSIWFGSLEPVSRDEFNALSNNLNTMQTNAELSWDRVSALDERTGQIADMVTTARSELDSMSITVSNLQSDLSDTREELTASIDDLSGQLDETTAALQEMQAFVDETQARIEQYNAFFESLGDLIGDLNQ